MSCRCHSAGGYCQCLVSDTQCIIVNQVDPFRLEFVIDPASDNLAESTPQGLQVVLPQIYTNPVSAGVSEDSTDSIVLPEGQLVLMPFNIARWDTHGGFNSLINTRRVTFASDGVYAFHTNVGITPNDESFVTVWAGPIVTSSETGFRFFYAQGLQRTAAGPGDWVNSGWIDFVRAGDYVEFGVQSNFTTENTVGHAPNVRNFLSLTRIGGL